MKAGDKIKLPDYCMGHREKTWTEFEVVEFRHTLGIFGTPQDKEAGRLTPLCDLYESGPDSEQSYISNYGEYYTNLVPAFIQIAG